MSIYCAEVLSESMGDVKVLLIRQRPDGFILERFSDSGMLVRDTRHDEMDEAMRQAYSEYGTISDWHLCPDRVDPLEYIRAVGSGG
jgi:hypothetical protein